MFELDVSRRTKGPLPPLKFRTIGNSETELNLVLSSWSSCFRQEDGNPLFGMMKQSVYYDNYKPLIHKILNSSTTLFAVNPDDPDQIYGYVVFRYLGEAPVISYLYVKHVYRKLGIASALLDQARGYTGKQHEAAFITHTKSYYGHALYRNNLIFNPFLDWKLLGEK